MLCQAVAEDRLNAISIDSVIAISNLSKRTLWRRLSDGTLTRVEGDARGRTMVAIAEVAPLVGVSMGEEDLALLVKADAGDPEAQDDMGQFFLAVGKHVAARYWLEQAALQEHPNAMQCLGRCYLEGDIVERDDNFAIMWIAKAAAHGHAIAQAQVQALIGQGRR